jgi:hypothetical protein
MATISTQSHFELAACYQAEGVYPLLYKEVAMRNLPVHSFSEAISFQYKLTLLKCLLTLTLLLAVHPAFIGVFLVM